MALLVCPDCGGPVSDQAPACPRCGRPVAPHADAHDPPARTSGGAMAGDDRPMPGIVVGCLIAVAGVGWSLAPAHHSGRHPDVEAVATVMHGVFALGYAALLVGCLLSLARHASGNRTVRRTSWTMLALVPLLYGLAAATASPYATTPAARNGLALVLTLAAVVALLPWLLCLYLFRASRYP